MLKMYSNRNGFTVCRCVFHSHIFTVMQHSCDIVSDCPISYMKVKGRRRKPYSTLQLIPPEGGETVTSTVQRHSSRLSGVGMKHCHYAQHAIDYAAYKNSLELGFHAVVSTD